ncbi:probable receptor-like protein kinase At5g24010 [Zingiber officinale]|uniref:probable receptor-like protein kinase At5g24010 n=1 Tax=Zingiber officinale TaxID=94328 RepID=UPI001C4D6BDB|nr:probable receptor-like protein kinase At5g24010 [Zingiber officinale]
MSAWAGAYFHTSDKFNRALSSNVHAILPDDTTAPMDHYYFLLHILLLLLLRAPLLLAANSTDFSPSYFLNCGSKSNITTSDSLPRDFVTDFNFVSGELADNSFPLSDPSSSFPFSSLYSTARVFTGTASYTFTLNSTGVLGLRLHFRPFSTDDRNLSAALFRVTAQRVPLLDNFSVDSSAAPVIKEYFLWFDSTSSTNLEFTFLPASSSVAFVNAVEVFTTPTYLFKSSSPADLSSNQIVETVHRINVGGIRITPTDDTMWRTWIPDDTYLFNKKADLENSTTTAINYGNADVTKVVAPESVYSTARTMNIPEEMRLGNPDFNFNVSWNFTVDAGYNYLVRAHFCDFISQANVGKPIIFTLYVADQSKEINSREHASSPNVPFYLDTRAVELPSGWIDISIGRSYKTAAADANAYLNGLEIFKFNSIDSSKRSVPVAVIASVSAGSAVLLSLVVFLLVLLARKHRRRSKSRPLLPKETWSPYRRGTTLRGNSVDHSSKPTEATTAQTASPRVNLDLNIPLLEIRAATNDFDESLVVGRGGFGKVYKGILGDGTEVAVKRAVPGSKQGYPEFQTEILVLSKIRHRHLVSLIGYCEEQSERILVYDYMEKGPLRNYLYGSDDKPCLSWKQRLEICIGAARGLHYLHTGDSHTIIHRDVKSTNILLDKTYLAKVSDFGLSRLGPSIGETHVTTGVKGTFGYFDPEYFKTQQLTEKSDVYSFGVVLLEVLCARPAIDRSLSHEQMNLAEWALHWQRRGQLEKTIDQRLVGKINANSLRKFGETAEKCLANYGDDRPSFADVLWNLEYALQLHVTELKREPHEDSGAVDLQISVTATRQVDLTTVANVDEENNWRTRSIMPLDASGSNVFSQLVSSEGR